jgi:hypothetical protein
MLCPGTSDEGGLGYVTYELTGGLGKAARLSAVIGIDYAVGTSGSATFVVEVLREEDWECAFESRTLPGGEHQETDVEVARARRLRLRTTEAGHHIHSDHAVRAEARLH